MPLPLEAGIVLVRIVLSFYGFWLVWRVLLPLLPGPNPEDERIAPYACYFTDPFLVPVHRLSGAPTWLLALLALIGVATALAALPS
jgi:hypothetical protein